MDITHAPERTAAITSRVALPPIGELTMLNRDSAAAILCAMTVALSITAANATERRHGKCGNDGQCISSELSAKRGDPRPARWCGWWLRQKLGVADRRFNLAREWARFGSPASGPCVGCIAVSRSHVGIVTGIPGAGRIVMLSGNDDGAVRERERSSRNIIAWRHPNGGMASDNTGSAPSVDTN